MNEFDEAQKLIEELFEEGSTDEMNEEELDSSEFTEEEMEALMKIQELLHIQETLHSHYIQKLLEYNKTHEVKMELESVTGEDGKTYVKYWGLLPVKNEEGEGEMRILLGITPAEEAITSTDISAISSILMGTTPAEEEPEEEVKVKPKREHIKKSARAEARERLEARIDPDLICPMNALITVLKETDDWKREKTKAIPIEKFLVPVKGRADSHHTKKIREYAEELNTIMVRDHINQAKNPFTKDEDRYILLNEKIQEIRRDMKKSIKKMNQKTMSQSIKLALGCGTRVTPEVKKTYSKVRFYILNLLYNYDKDLFLSCFKKSENELADAAADNKCSSEK